jgi:hypothetical protein
LRRAVASPDRTDEETIMIGGNISRWTMTYFAAALTWLLAALALMAAGIGHPATDLAAPDTLVLVHPTLRTDASQGNFTIAVRTSPRLVVSGVFVPTTAADPVGDDHQ